MLPIFLLNFHRCHCHRITQQWFCPSPLLPSLTHFALLHLITSRRWRRHTTRTLLEMTRKWDEVGRGWCEKNMLRWHKQSLSFFKDKFILSLPWVEASAPSSYMRERDVFFAFFLVLRFGAQWFLSFSFPWWLFLSSEITRWRRRMMKFENFHIHQICHRKRVATPTLYVEICHQKTTTREYRCEFTFWIRTTQWSRVSVSVQHFARSFKESIEF